MSCNEDFGATRLNFLQSLWLIVTGIASDMGHQHTDPLALEVCELGVAISDRAVIYISVYSPKGFKGCNFVGALYRAYISCVPNLIDIFEKVLQAVVKGAVCIGDYAYSSH